MFSSVLTYSCYVRGWFAFSGRLCICTRSPERLRRDSSPLCQIRPRPPLSKGKACERIDVCLEKQNLKSNMHLFSLGKTELEKNVGIRSLWRKMGSKGRRGIHWMSLVKLNSTHQTNIMCVVLAISPQDTSEHNDLLSNVNLEKSRRASSMCRKAELEK